jgi:hypothetical protein
MKATWSDDWDSSLNDDQEYVANMRFIAIESDNEESREYEEWLLDSVCSRHMTEDDSLFSSISKINGGKVTFKDNLKVKIIGVGNIRGKSSALIEKVFLVNNLKYNLLSISQLCDKVLFVCNKKRNVYEIKIDVCIRI